MEPLMRPVCPKCEGRTFRYSFVFAVHKAETFGLFEEQVATKLHQQETAIRDVLLKADQEREKLSHAFKAKKLELVSDRNRKEMLWRDELARALEAVKKEIEADNDLALLADEGDIARTAQRRVGALDDYNEKFEKMAAALDARYEGLMTAINNDSQKKASELTKQQLSEIRDFGMRTENEAITIVNCSTCGQIIGICPNPSATRFTETCELLQDVATATQKSSAEIVAAIRDLVGEVQASNKLAAAQQACIEEGFNMLARILTAPTTTTSIGVEF